MPGSSTHQQLHALHTTWPAAQQQRAGDKPLPNPPSPTLTNPDYILPSSGVLDVSSPPRVTRRPPSPSYLRDSESPSPKAAAAMARKDKLGLMSRKMLLLRSRTASGGVPNGSSARASPSQGSIDTEFIPSSPVLQDVGNLAPEQPEYLQLPETDRRSNSGGSSSSDISGMTNFLARYGKTEGTSDDEALYENGESPAPARYESAEEHDAEADRRRREEYNSAVLSKRAEEILANAKKRLNVMEGNLRGARDLVAPLTAANLKRATSLGSADFSPTYGHGRRYAPNVYDYNEEDQQSPRRLNAQTSSPTMGRDYQGHSRGFSETEIPERPYTSLDHPHSMMSRSIRAPGRGAEVVANHALRGSRSYDSLGSSGVGYSVGRDRPLHARESPDSSHLEPLQEADENRRSFRDSRNGAGVNNGLGIYRPSSRTSDLREQMTNLKGKISTLKERAREDSLRRQSQSSLRNSSPFNNAAGGAPELFYSSAASYGSPGYDANARIGHTSNSDSPASPQKVWENVVPITGSRNAFAEQAAAQHQNGLQQARVVEIVAPKTPDSKFQLRRPKDVQPLPQTGHRRTASGTAIIDSAKNRYSHHQRTDSQETAGTRADEDEEHLGVPSPGLTPDLPDSSPVSSHSSHVDDDYAPSEDDGSVYEDAQHDQEDENPVVAHEDREDAFDYEHFFLHSAMGTYSTGRRGSDSSGASTSSASTARGPALAGHEDEEAFNHDSALYPPSTPETPEKLKQIERNLHKRSLSDESISTLDTFATADEDPEDHESNESDESDESDEGYEGPVSPDEDSRRISTFSQRAISPLESGPPNTDPSASYITARSGSQPSSRPGTAVKDPILRDSNSDRADSGVGGISHRQTASTGSQRAPPGSLTPKQGHVRLGSALSTPPTSPPGVGRQDPATVAVNALLDPTGRSLGLRNKAVLFGVIESLRNAVHQLQDGDETDYHSRILRKRLEDAKAVLEGKMPSL